MEPKQWWRRVLRERAAMAAGGRGRAMRSRAIRGNLARLIRDKRPRRIFAFAPTAHEPDLWPLLRRLQRRGIFPAFPKVSGRRILFLRVDAIRHLYRGAFGIREPGQGWICGRARKGDIVLVPCVGLDRRGWRLGHGGGFYDRWLKLNPRGLKVAVLFHCQIVQSLPHNSRDSRVDLAVTEQGIKKQSRKNPGL